MGIESGPSCKDTAVYISGYLYGMHSQVAPTSSSDS